ncbi:MAG: type II toxin-antitoxin system VapC family toxin [Nitrospiraceae bacterium]
MRLLLDTHVYLWYLADSPKLSATARATIASAEEIFVSAASIWEATIKAGLGKVKADLPRLVEGIEASGFSELPVTAAHAAAVAHLRPLHRDSFDRLLVAQAIFEPLRLLTADPALVQYSDLVQLV